MDEKLKPCPFCGDEMVKGEFGFDHPENDDCIIGFGSFANYYRAAWNTRTPSRNDVLEEAALIAEWAHMVPPDGGSPSEAEKQVADNAAAAIRARKDQTDG